MPTTTRRYYSNKALPATLTAAVDAVQTTIPVSTVTGLPTSFPFAVTLDRTAPSNIEIVEVTSLTGNTLNVTRGVDGTTAVTHPLGAPAEHTSVARDFDSTNNHASSSSVSGAHGSIVQGDVTSGYVDLTNAQTVSGVKTFNGRVTVVRGSGALNFYGSDDSFVSTTTTGTTANTGYHSLFYRQEVDGAWLQGYAGGVLAVSGPSAGQKLKWHTTGVDVTGTLTATGDITGSTSIINMGTGTNRFRTVAANNLWYFQSDQPMSFTTMNAGFTRGTWDNSGHLTVTGTVSAGSTAGQWTGSILAAGGATNLELRAGTAGNVFIQSSAGTTTYATFTSSTLTLPGKVIAGTGQGFRNLNYTLGAANPIWSFDSAPAYGMAYYQNNAGVSGNTASGGPGSDSLGFHFGTIASPEFFVRQGSGTYFNTKLFGNGKEMFDVTDGFLRLNQSGAFGNGIWTGGSYIRSSVGSQWRLGSSGGQDGNVVLLSHASDNTTRITLNGSDGNITATGALSLGSTFSGAGADSFAEDVRLSVGTHGGGTVTLDGGGNLTWSQRFIAIALRSASRGYIDINVPASGTVITVVNSTTTSVTTTAAGVPMAGGDGWMSLYFVPGTGTYRMSGYNGAAGTHTRIPSEWILLASRNGDTGTVFVHPIKSLMRPGDVVNTANGTGRSQFVNLTDTQTVGGAKTFTSAVSISAGNNALSINNNGGIAGFMANFTNNVDQDLQFRVTASGAADKYSLIAPSTVGRLAFGTSSVERMSINNSGDLRFTGTLQQGTVPWARLSDVPASASRFAAWSEVTSKPSAWLDASALTTTVTDLNILQRSGFFDAAPGALNQPENTWSNILNHRHSNDGNAHGWQLVGGYYNHNLYFRHYQGTGGTGSTTGTYGAWKRIPMFDEVVNRSDNQTIAGEKTYTGLAITQGRIQTGRTDTNYGGAWDANIQVDFLDTGSINFHDAGNRVDSIRVNGGVITIGHDIGWGTATVNAPGTLQEKGSRVYSANNPPPTPASLAGFSRRFLSVTR